MTADDDYNACLNIKGNEYICWHMYNTHNNIYIVTQNRIRKQLNRLKKERFGARCEQDQSLFLKVKEPLQNIYREYVGFGI